MKTNSPKNQLQMDKHLTFHAAQAHESAHGAALLMLTLHELGDYFFGFGDHNRAMNVLQRLFERPRNRFSHQYTLFGKQDDGQIVGLLLPFTRRSMQFTWLATGLDLISIYRGAKMHTIVERLLQYRSEEHIPQDEFYIAHMAVDPQHQRKGYGYQILEHAQELAHSQGFPKLSLLTEIENQSAINLYQKFGFQITKTIRYPQEMQNMGSKGSIRMVKEINH